MVASLVLGLLILRYFIVLSSVILLWIGYRAYKKTIFSNYIILILLALLLSISSLLEILSINATDRQTAETIYLITAIIRSFMIYSLGGFLISLSDEPWKLISLSGISMMVSIEVMETIYRPFIIKQINNYWVVQTVRSPLAYIARSFLLIIAILVFTLYIYKFIKRTINQKRKAFSVLILVEIYILLFLDSVNYIIAYPIINQTISALTEFLFVLVLLLIALIDPYYYIFFRGEVKVILIFRNDGVLLGVIKIKELTTRNEDLLLGNLLSAISHLGMETFLRDQIDSIQFKGNTILIEMYDNLYITIIGSNLPKNIKKILREFLVKFYYRFKHLVESKVITVPKDREISELFAQELGKIIL